MHTIDAPVHELLVPSPTMAFDAKPRPSAARQVLDTIAAYLAGHYDTETNRKLETCARDLREASPADKPPSSAEQDEAIFAWVCAEHAAGRTVKPDESDTWHRCSKAVGFKAMRQPLRDALQRALPDRRRGRPPRK
jgi:hypothetical protein